MTVTDERRVTARPFPPGQADAAREVDDGVVFYSSATGRWYRGDEGEDEIGGDRGRLLRSLRAAGCVAADPESMPDGRRARLMALTRTGRARLSATSS